MISIDPTKSVDWPLMSKIRHCKISFTESSHDIGISTESKLPMKYDVNNIFLLAYYVQSVQSVNMIQSEYLTFQAALFTSLVLICLDWGNSLHSDILDYIFHKVQKLQNCGARLIFGVSKVSLLYWKHCVCFPFPSG